MPGTFLARGTENGAGETLVLADDETGIALLPHGTVENGEDWCDAATEAVAALTGITVELEEAVAVREVDHVVGGDVEATTHRLVFTGRPAGGAIQECKRSAEAGRDGWLAAWYETLPEGVTPPPEEGPRADMTLTFV